MTDKTNLNTLAPPELAERALVEELATQMALAAGYAPHCWPTWEREATVIIPTIAKYMATRLAAHPQPTGDVGALVERLMETEPRFCQLTGKELYAIYPNRDGPEAAAAILALTAEVERKDAAYDELRRYIYDKTPERREWAITKHRAAIGKAEQ